jgi:hypothetical protein
MIEQVT